MSIDSGGFGWAGEVKARPRCGCCRCGCEHSCAPSTPPLLCCVSEGSLDTTDRTLCVEGPERMLAVITAAERSHDRLPAY